MQEKTEEVVEIVKTLLDTEVTLKNRDHLGSSP